MILFADLSDWEARTSGTSDWTACAVTFAICPVNQSYSTERSLPTFAWCGRRPASTIWTKPSGVLDCRLLFEPSRMVCGNESGQEAANSRGDNGNGLPWQGPFCSARAFSFWTKRLPVSIPQQKTWFSTIFGET